MSCVDHFVAPPNAPQIAHDPRQTSCGEDMPLPARFERQLGDTEASYFLPSRQDGVNDM